MKELLVWEILDKLLHQNNDMSCMRPKSGVGERPEDEVGRKSELSSTGRGQKW